MKKCGQCRCNLSENLFKLKDDGTINKMCIQCSNKYSLLYENKKIANLCTICFKNKPAKNRSNCRKCLNKALEKQKEKRSNAILNGICISCNKRAPSLNNLRCERCIKKYWLPIRTKLFRGAQSRAKKKNIEFSISEIDIVVPEYCPIFKIKLKENNFISKPDSYSLDRIDSSLGYIKGNIHVISHRANQIKNDATLEELKILVNYLESLKI